MSKYKVGYIVGSLAKGSINRQLAHALAKLAAPQLELVEIPMGTCRCTATTTTRISRRWRARSSRRSPRSTRCCSSRRNTTARSPAR